MRRIGIDLALRSDHTAVVYEDGVAVSKPFKVPRTMSGVIELERRAGNEPCEFLMEPTGLVWLPLAAELKRRGFSVYLPKTQKISALRKFYKEHTKTDINDASALALVHHVDPKGVYELELPTATNTSLRFDVKNRAKFVKEAANSKVRIKAWMELINPHLCDTIDLFSKPGRVLLRRHLDSFEVVKKGKKRLKQIYQHHSRGELNVEKFEAVWEAYQSTAELYSALHKASQLPFDIKHMQDLVGRELDRIEFLETQIQSVEKSIKRLYKELDPELTLQREIPGVADTIAPALEALIGNIERFPNAKKFAGFVAFVPKTNQTGGTEGKSGQPITKGGPNLLKHYMFLAADTARRYDPKLAAIYSKAIEGGKHHTSAVVIVAHALARRIYAVLKLRSAARRARSEGLPTNEIPVVEYIYRHPQTGRKITREEARLYLLEHYPSKKERANTKKKAARTKTKKATRSASSKSGSPIDATTRIDIVPPNQLATFLSLFGGVENPVDNSIR